MKKTYTAPTCELLGTNMTGMICGVSVDGMVDNLDITWGGKDDQGKVEADANEVQWDHLEQGL